MAILCVVAGGGYVGARALGAPNGSNGASSTPSSTGVQTTVRESPTSTSSGSPTTAPQAADPLSGVLAAYLGRRTGVVAVAVKDLATGQTWTTGSAAPQPEASVVKVEILADLLWRQETGGGLPAAIQTDAKRMIENSTDAAATELWNAAGGAAGLGTFDRAAGLAATTPSSCLTCPGFSWPGWGLTTTTPSDQLTLLSDLVDSNRVLSAAQRSYELSLMEQVTPAQAWGVSSGVPPGVTVALKNGWVPLDGTRDWQINSIGWIDGGGRDYLLAVMTTGNPTMGYGVDTVDQVGSDVYQALGSSCSKDC